MFHKPPLVIITNKLGYKMPSVIFQLPYDCKATNRFHLKSLNSVGKLAKGAV